MKMCIDGEESVWVYYFVLFIYVTVCPPGCTQYMFHMPNGANCIAYLCLKCHCTQTDQPTCNVI